MLSDKGLSRNIIAGLALATHFIIFYPNELPVTDS